MFDLEPATTQLSALIEGVRAEHLDGPTPCSPTNVAGLLNHIDGFCQAFTAAATKVQPAGGSQPPAASAEALDPQWRSRIPERLTGLTLAWRERPAWSGMTEAGGVALPAEVAAHFALDEVIVHSWDLAVATGQQMGAETELLAVLQHFLRSSVAQNPDGVPGLFGPAVPIPADAPPLDQVVGLTGRDPSWKAHVHLP